MNNLDTFLSSVKSRLETATKLPHKQFPFVFIQRDGEFNETSQAKLMNEYLDHGFKSISDLARLVRVVGCLREACVFNSMPVESKPETWTVENLKHTMDNDSIRAKEALAKAQQIVAEGENV